MRVVIDTNVLISALLSEVSLPANILLLWRQGRFDLLTSSYQLDELRRVTRYPKIRDRLPTVLAGRLINDLRGTARVLAATPASAISRDPDDDYLLAIADAGLANFIITGDKRDLLSLKLYKGAKIVSARDFMQVTRL